MISRLLITSFLSLSVLLVGCDKTASPSADQKSAEADTPEKKLAELTKHAEQGNAQAQFSLGSMYHKGEGVSKDVGKAVEWYQKAATQGDANAQYNLGAMYNQGEGVSKDLPKGFEWWQKAAAQGNARAQVQVGYAFQWGWGVKKDAAKAFEMFEKAAKQGDAEAQYLIGTAYLVGKEDLFTGLGQRKDYAKAIEWLRKSAEQGNVSGQGMLSLIYANGSGVAKNDVTAFEWMLKAAVQGDLSAQNRIGHDYQYGWGVAEDLVLAYAWCNLAASNVDDKLDDVFHYKRDRDKLENQLSHSQKAEAQRLSSAWKKGQILVREGRSASTTPSGIPGKLSKNGTGTLFVVNTAGQAITNDHVIAGCDELRIEGRDGLAKVVIEDAVNDLALVQIPGDAKASAAITAEPDKLRQGEDIAVFGFPLNSVLSSGGNLTPGVVSALTGLGNNTNQIQITAAIQPGSSGSPVLNKKGEVVGVVSMKLSDSQMVKATRQVAQNINFAVNGQTLRTFFDTHKVTYRSGAGFFTWDKSTADLADEARKWTLVVECWK